ncbi:acyltransferase [Williamsia sp. 1138]|nr:acyltransferase [Williamsia sp. 1138]
MEWHLRDRSAAKDLSAAAATGPSFLQRDHLMAAVAKREIGETNQAIAMIATTVDGRLHREAMSRTLTTFVRRHDELRCWYQVDDGAPTRYLIPDKAIEFTAAAIGPSGDHDQLRQYVSSRIDSEAVFDHLPGYAFGAIDAGDTFSFYFVADHSHTDGVSQALALDEILEIYRHELHGGELELLPAGNYVDYVADEINRAGQVRIDDPLLDDWRRILKTHKGKIPRFPLDLGLRDGETMATAVAEQLVINGSQADRLDERLRSMNHSGSLQGCTFAALAAAENVLTGNENFFTTTILAIRSTEHLGTQGWLCNFAPIAFPVNHGDKFDDLVRIATVATRKAREIGTVPVHAALAYLAAEGSIDLESGSPQMVSFFDLRRLPRADDPAKKAALILPGRGRTRNANMWINRGDFGIRLLYQFPDNDTARKNTAEYFSIFSDFLRGFADGDDRTVRRGLAE